MPGTVVLLVGLVFLVVLSPPSPLFGSLIFVGLGVTVVRGVVGTVGGVRSSSERARGYTTAGYRATNWKTGRQIDNDLTEVVPGTALIIRQPGAPDLSEDERDAARLAAYRQAGVPEPISIAIRRRTPQALTIALLIGVPVSGVAIILIGLATGRLG